MKKIIFFLFLASCAAQRETPNQLGSVALDTNIGKATENTLRAVIATDQVVTNPCQGLVTILVAGSIKADTEIIPPAPGKRHFCSIAINAASNERVSLVESTTSGGTCPNPTVILGSNNDSEGWYMGSGVNLIINALRVSTLSNAATCLRVNTGNVQIDYSITYINQ